MLTHIVRHIFRTARHTNFKLGIPMKDADPHQPQAPWPPRSKIKVARSRDQYEPSWPNAVPVIRGRRVIPRRRNLVATFLVFFVMAAVKPVGMKFCTTVELCSGRITFWWWCLQGPPNAGAREDHFWRLWHFFPNWRRISKKWYVLSCSVTRKLDVTWAWRRLSKNVWHGAIDSRAVPYKAKYVVFFSFFLSIANFKAL